MNKYILLTFLLLIIVFCNKTSSIVTYFSEVDYNYPLHFVIDYNSSPKWVCPDSGEHKSPEHIQFITSGFDFLRSKKMAYFLQVVDENAEAFVLSDPFVFVDPCNNPIESFAINVDAYYSYNEPSKHEITIPHSFVDKPYGKILIMSNVLLLEQSDESWKSVGYVF